MYKSHERSGGNILVYGAAGTAVVMLLIFALCFSSVSIGQAAIIINPLSGSVSDQPVIGARWFFKSPWSSAVRIRYTMATLGMWGGTGNNTDPTADFPTIGAFSAEGVDLGIDLAVRFSLDVNKLTTLYENYPGLNWEQTTISSIVRETTRFVIKDYGWEQVRDQRDTVAIRLQTEITEALNKEPSLGGAIINIEVDLRNVLLPKELVKAVNEKVAAKEIMLMAEYRRQAKLIEANATAQADIIDATGDAEARRLRAEGEARAIEALIASVGEEGWQLFYEMQKLKEISTEVDTLILSLGNEGQLDLILPPS